MAVRGSGSRSRTVKTRQCRAGRQACDVVRVPRTLPAAEGKQAVEQIGGEAPDQHLARAKRRPGGTRRVPDHEPAVGIGEFSDRDSRDSGNLVETAWGD